MPNPHFSPKEFLKSRRPERFSDTVVQEVPQLDRSILEYHLETLTKRSEEAIFERFAKGLLERTVCPNLMPHTGPTGGGDSKTDSETYPVAEQLTFSWHTGHGDLAATQRWAFAFSAKEDWRPKVDSDIRAIVGTNRGYVTAFFVSSRYIPDKRRAEAEDSLRKKHGIDVRIFDRMWILDRVFGEHHEAYAIEQLNIGTSVRREIRMGPRDTVRRQQLDAVESEIAVAVREGRLTPGLAEMCLHAADLARSLELPRPQVEGLYSRAARTARECGTKAQQIECAYETAWTIFWWYEDYATFRECYSEFIDKALQSDNPYHLELWTNLFFCLHTAHLHVGRDPGELFEPLAQLTQRLDGLASDANSPSAALQGKTMALYVRLLTAPTAKKGRILEDLANIIPAVEGLAGYPFVPFANIVTELGKSLPPMPEYDSLFEAVVTASSRRREELAAARMLLARGAQHMEASRWLDAIRLLGRAMGRLFKYESRADAIRALYLCSQAYESLGLPWAARGTLISAANLAANEAGEHGTVIPQQALCCNRMKWIELRLGRLGHILAWHHSDCATSSVLADRGYSTERLNETATAFDGIFGILLLKTDLWALARLSGLPEVLEAVGLPGAATALLYALGHEDRLPVEWLGNEFPTWRDLFKRWREQPAADDLPSQPLLCAAQSLLLESRIAGCHISVNCANDRSCLALSESLLACLEAMMATALGEKVVAHEPSLSLKVRPAEFLGEPFIFEARDNHGKPEVDMQCSNFTSAKLTADQLARVRRDLFGIAAHVVARVFMIADAEALFTKLFREELALQRALDFTAPFLTASDLVGDDRLFEIGYWSQKAQQTYPLIRDTLWDDGLSCASDARPIPTSSLASSAEPTPSVTADVAHSEVRTVSVVRIPLWNAAKWCGTAYATSDDPALPPSWRWYSATQRSAVISSEPGVRNLGQPTAKTFCESRLYAASTRLLRIGTES